MNFINLETTFDVDNFKGLNKSFQYVKYYFKSKFDKIIKVDDIDLLENKCILLIGETGGGKTTFLELFFNYIKHKFEYDKYSSQVKSLNENIKKSPLELELNETKNISMTNQPIGYKIRIKNKNKFFYIIDTPGLKDLEGFSKDEKHLDGVYFKLKEIENESIENIMVLFFYNGEQSKLLDIEKYVFESYKIFFDNEIKIKTIATRKNELSNMIKVENLDVLPLNNPIVLRKVIQFRKENKNKLTMLSEGGKDDYKKNTQRFEELMERNERNFLNIISYIVYNNLFKIEIKEMILNYSNYFSLRKLLDNLELKFNEYLLDFNLLNDLRKKKINKLSLKELKEEIKNSIIQNPYITTDNKTFLKNPELYNIHCYTCFLPISFQSIINDIRYGFIVSDVGISIHYEHTCDHLKCEKLFFRKYENVNELTKKFKELYNLKTDKIQILKTLKTKCEKILNEIDEMIESKELEKIRELIKTIQKKTMLKDFETHLKLKIDYLNRNTKSMMENCLKEDELMFRRYIEKYTNIIRILYNNGHDNLKNSLNKLKNIFILIV